MTGRQFVSDVTRRNSVTIPNKFANHHEIEEGDSLELRIVSHKRDNETLYDETTNES